MRFRILIERERRTGTSGIEREAAGQRPEPKMAVESERIAFAGIPALFGSD